MEENGRSARIVHIDMLKGVAAFLVVLGHIVTYDADFHGLYNLIYAFHMPLFMFLSGCTTQLSYRSRTGSDGIYLKKRFLNIMVPYFAWAFLLPVVSAGKSNGINWHSVLTRTFVTNRMFWFLPTLYGLTVAYIGYRRIGDRFQSSLECCGKNKKARFLFDGISIVLVVGVIGILMIWTGYQLFRDVIGFSIPFFAAVLYMEHEWVHELFHRRMAAVAALFLFVMLIGRFDFDRAAVETSLLRMLLGMCAVIVLFQMSVTMRFPRFVVKVLTLWGQHSLLIYILHIQIMQNSGLLKLDLPNKAVTLLWYCAVSCLVCCAASLLAAGIVYIPIARFILLGKKGDSHVKK